MTSRELCDELALELLGAFRRLRPGRTRRGVSGERLVTPFGLLGNERRKHGARLLERNRQRRLRAVAQGRAAAPETEVDDVLIGGDLDQVDLVQLVALALPKPEPRLIDDFHRARTIPEDASERSENAIAARKPLFLRRFVPGLRLLLRALTPERYRRREGPRASWL